jgi:hypothetical protein
MAPSDLAEQILRATRSLADPALRVSYLCAVFREHPIEELARALDTICADAEQASEPSRGVLVALVDAVNAPEAAAVVQTLREQALGDSLLALERVLRRPATPSVAAAPRDALKPAEERVPDYGRGRSLTLGERKALARKPSREFTARLLADPHPEVIKRLLGNPNVTEDDVLRLAAKRPVAPEILVEIARSPRWLHRSRVRLAIVLNPDVTLEIAAPIVALLLRQELRLVISSTQASPAVRALCLEHVQRRPPTPDGKGSGTLQ